MRSYILSAILGIASLGFLGVVSPPAQAQSLRDRNRPVYTYYYSAPASYYYSAPTVTYPTPTYTTYFPSSVPSDSSNVYVGNVYSTYWPGYTIYYPRTIYYSAPTTVVYPYRRTIYSDFP
jgi:hypothetical protein